MDDITRAQQEAAADSDQPQLKLAIRDEPIRADPDAQNAFSSVANTLRAVCLFVTAFVDESLSLSHCSKHHKSPNQERLAPFEGVEMSETLFSCPLASRSRVLASVDLALEVLPASEPPQCRQLRLSIWQVQLQLSKARTRSLFDPRIP